MTVLCLGQVRAISETAQAWPPTEGKENGMLLRVCEMLAENVVSIADLAASIMEQAWSDLFAGQVEDPQGRGEKLRDATDSLARLETLLQRRRAAGLAVPDMDSLTRARALLARLGERFAEGWPYLSPEEISRLEQARQRPRSEYPTLEEFARRFPHCLSTRPDAAPSAKCSS
jgi:hypothetical protein